MSDIISISKLELDKNYFLGNPTYHSTPLMKCKIADDLEPKLKPVTVFEDTSLSHPGRYNLPPSYLSGAIKDELNGKSLNNGTEHNILYRQRKELQMLINELKLRDKELNDMVHSHHKQLVSWEIDRQHMFNMETQLSKFKAEAKKRHSQCKVLKGRLRNIEGGMLSKQSELETTQTHLHQVTMRANQSSNQIEELQQKNKSLKSSVEELSLSIANFQLREQKSSTAFNRKEEDAASASKRVDELTSKLLEAKDSIQELKSCGESYKSEALRLRSENSKLEKDLDDLRKSMPDIHAQSNFEDTTQMKYENLHLQKELFHAGEREKRKDCLIELSRSRQERTETELNHMRKLYENLQRELLTLKHRLADQEDRFSIVSDLETSISGVENLYSSSNVQTVTTGLEMPAPVTVKDCDLHLLEQEDIGEMRTNELKSNSFDPFCHLDSLPTMQLKMMLTESRTMIKDLDTPVISESSPN